MKLVIMPELGPCAGRGTTDCETTRATLSADQHPRFHVVETENNTTTFVVEISHGEVMWDRWLTGRTDV